MGGAQSETYVEVSGNHQPDENWDDEPEHGKYGQNRDRVERTCTDKLCSCLFLVYIGGLSTICLHAFKDGLPQRLTHSYDWKGRLCGVDENVTDKPYLFFCREGERDSEGTGVDFHGGEYPQSGLNLQAPVCMLECPTGSAELIPCVTHTSLSQKVDKTGNARSVVTSAIQKEVWKAVYPSKLFAGRFCLPDIHGYLEHPGLREKLQDSLFGPNHGPLGTIGMQFHFWMGSVKRAWPLLLGALLLSIILSITYLGLLQKHAKKVAYGSFWTLFVVLLCGSVFFFLPVFTPAAKTPVWDEVNPDDANLVSIILGSLLAFLAVVLFVILSCSHDKIAGAVQIVEVAADCFNATRSYPFTLFECILKAFTFAFFVVVFVYLVSTGHLGNFKDRVQGLRTYDLDRGFYFDEWSPILSVLLLFGCYWTLEVVTAFGQFAASFAAERWYFTEIEFSGEKGVKRAPDEGIWKGARLGLTKHLGSLCLGGILMNICKWLRILFGYIIHQAQNHNSLCVSISQCFGPCITCYIDHVEYVTKTAYVDIAITSSNFFLAAGHTHTYLNNGGQEIEELADAQKCHAVSEILEIMGALAISGISAAAVYACCLFMPWFHDPTSVHYIQNPQAVAVCGLIIALVAAASFMSVFDQTADAILYCYLWNRNHDHNSVSKYATKALKDLVNWQPVGVRVLHPGNLSQSTDMLAGVHSFMTSKKAAQSTNWKQTQVGTLDHHRKEPMLSYSR